MRAMVMTAAGNQLSLNDLPIPTPSDHQVLIEVHACGICRTDLHVIDGELRSPKLPLIPGHQIVGIVKSLGANVSRLAIGQRVGVPWLGGTCGKCHYCVTGRENLCDFSTFTGYQINGGFAEYCVADADYCFPIPDQYSDIQAAPLLCAGLIGYRALAKTQGAKKLGIYGFGAAAHIVVQIANQSGTEVYAFTKPGDLAVQEFARKMGAKWSGDSTVQPPVCLDAAIIFAFDGELVPLALRAIDKGGIVVCGGIHMSDIPSFPYDILWGERCICSVANLTRKDGHEFMRIAADNNIQTEVHVYPLDKANNALDDLRYGRFTGAAVISVRE